MTDAMTAVAHEIQSIMRTYRDQESSPGGVSTPGGLEHMGDVWRLLAKWDSMISESAATPKASS